MKRVWDATPFDEVQWLLGHTEAIASVSFSSDDSLIFTESVAGDRIVWDATTGAQLADKRGESIPSSKRVSTDGRLFLTWSGRNALRVDLEFKNRKYEQKLRVARAKLNISWHKDEADLAHKSNNFFAELFHRAWVLKSDLNDAGANEAFRAAHEKLVEEFAAKNQMVTPFLSPVVLEALQLDRGGE